MVEGNTKPVGSLLQYPGELLDVIVAQLDKVGIDLPPLYLQIFLLLLVVALLFPTIKRLRARTEADRSPLIAIVALGLLATGVVIGLIDNATMLDHVTGTLQSDRLADVHVALLDFRDHAISSDSGLVDTTTGQFALHYKPLVDGRARKLRVIAPSCRLEDVPLFREQLRAGSELQWTYRCVAS